MIAARINKSNGEKNMTNFLNMTRNLVLLAAATFMSTPMANAQLLNKAQLKELTASASTAQDHEKLAKHFDAKAAEYEADAKEYEELAVVHSGNGHSSKHPMSGLTAEHCKYFAAKAHDAAGEARKVAADHRTMAKADSGK
jgi:Ni/Co efflux regulator RcnB